MSKKFTLIELLIVIAIIALLAAMLLPVLQQTKEKQKQTVCINNYKQIAYAGEMYRGDNDDFFALHFNHDNNRHWLDLYYPYLRNKISAGTEVFKDVIYSCPTNRIPENYYASPDGYLGYVQNAYLSKFVEGLENTLKIHAMKKPDLTPILAERGQVPGSAFSGTSYGAFRSTQSSYYDRFWKLGFPHNDNFMYACFGDTHVSKLSAPTINTTDQIWDPAIP